MSTYCSVGSSVADPDPYVFLPPGSGSISTRNGSGSLNRQSSIVSKTLISTVHFELASLTKIVGSGVGSRSVRQRCGSATLVGRVGERFLSYCYTHISRDFHQISQNSNHQSKLDIAHQHKTVSSRERSNGKGNVRKHRN